MRRGFIRRLVEVCLKNVACLSVIRLTSICTGILSETMGCGKTLICLAVILATRGHFPKIPTRYQATTNPVRERTGSLVEMAAAAAGRFSLPWKSHFELLRDSGVFYERCVAACEKHRGAYTIDRKSVV